MTVLAGGELRDDELSASQLKARYAQALSPEEEKRRFLRLTITLVVLTMVAELAMKCWSGAAYVIGEGLSWKLFGELSRVYINCRVWLMPVFVSCMYSPRLR